MAVRYSRAIVQRGGSSRASLSRFDAPTLVIRLRPSDERTLASLFMLDPDKTCVKTEINRLINEALVRYHEDA